MPKVKLDSIDEYRKTFEGYLGRQVTFIQWCRYKSEFAKTGLALNTNNLKLFANFKRNCPRKFLDKTILDILKEFQLRYRTKSEWLGIDVCRAIRKINPTIPDWQLYRAFYRAGLNFKAVQTYQQQDVYQIVFFALIYGGNNAQTII